MVSVTVHKALRGQAVVYVYRVKNNGAPPIVGFTVGFDPATGDPELTGHFPVPSTPTGWKVSIIRLEESDRFEIFWEAQGSAAALRAGSVSPPFRIKTVGDHSIYQKGHWMVRIDGSPTHVSGRFLQRPSQKRRVTSPR